MAELECGSKVDVTLPGPVQKIDCKQTHTLSDKVWLIDLKFDSTRFNLFPWAILPSCDVVNIAIMHFPDATSSVVRGEVLLT